MKEEKRELLTMTKTKHKTGSVTAVLTSWEFLPEQGR